MGKCVRESQNVIRILCFQIGLTVNGRFYLDNRILLLKRYWFESYGAARDIRCRVGNGVFQKANKCSHHSGGKISVSLEP